MGYFLTYIIFGFNPYITCEDGKEETEQLSDRPLEPALQYGQQFEFLQYKQKLRNYFSLII
jgi:hypothetical protein